MNDSQTETFWSALLKVIVECKEVAFDSQNPHFKSKYASLLAVNKEVKPILAKHGIVMTSAIQFCADSGCYELVTTLRNATGLGESSSRFPVFNPNAGAVKSQELMANITYGKRGNINALLNVDTDEDVDGNNTGSVTVTLATDPESLITIAQAKRLFSVAGDRGITPARAKAIIGGLGYASAKDIKQKDYERVYDLLINSDPEGLGGSDE